MMPTTQIEQASKLVAKIALELHRDRKMQIDECIKRAAWGVMFALLITQGDRNARKAKRRKRIEYGPT